MARYSPGPVPTTDLDNTQRWLREEYEQVRNSTDDIYTLANFLVDNYVIAGYGQIGRFTPVAMSNIGATWQTLQWESASIAEPRGVTYNLPTGLSVGVTGIWQIILLINLRFNDSNSGRELQARIFNVTDGVGGSPVTQFVGRNQDGITISLPYLSEVDVATGQPEDLAIQINSATDSFSGVSFSGGIWGVTHVSEYKGDFLQTLTSMDRSRG